MSRRNSKGPDKDMEKPKAYKSSIDPMKVQPSMSMDTRQKQYRSAKPIDFNNKISEYQPNNQYYKTSFWDAPKRKIFQPPPKQKEMPKTQPKPVVKRPPPKRTPAAPKPQNNPTLKPLPQPNLNFKKASIPAEPPKETHTLPQSQESSEIPVRHFEEPEPEVWASPPPSNQMEQWGEPNTVIPNLHPKPVPVSKEPDFTNLPASTVGSMTRMMAMFT